MKGGLRDLLRDLGAPEPPRHVPRQPATAAAFPASEGNGVRPVVQHRRRVRRTCPERIPARGPVSDARVAAEALFASPEPGTRT